MIRWMPLRLCQPEKTPATQLVADVESRLACIGQRPFPDPEGSWRFFVDVLEIETPSLHHQAIRKCIIRAVPDRRFQR